MAVGDPLRNPFRVLGVEPGATVEEVRRAYRALAKTLHPDVVGDDREAQRRMAEINRAYAAVLDPDAAPTASLREPRDPEAAPRPSYRTPGPDECDVCGHAPVAVATLVRQQASAGRSRRLSYVRCLCRNCGVALTTQALQRSLVRGWWGPAAVVQMPATIRADLDARATFSALRPPVHVHGVRGPRPTPMPLPRPPWRTAAGLMIVLVAITTLMVLTLR